MKGSLLSSYVRMECSGASVTNSQVKKIQCFWFDARNCTAKGDGDSRHISLSIVNLSRRIRPHSSSRYSLLWNCINDFLQLGVYCKLIMTRARTSLPAFVSYQWRILRHTAYTGGIPNFGSLKTLMKCVFFQKKVLTF